MKENDWIVATIKNPNFTVEDFKDIAGMTLDNTLLLSKDLYLNSSFITNNDLFKTDNRFDSAKFDEFYAQQVQKFGEFSTESTIDNYDYSMWDTLRPRNGNIRKEKITLQEVANPEHILIGIEGFNAVTKSPDSRKESAQKSKIFDTETGQFTDKSVNDISLFNNPIEYFASLFSEPLVYASYDSDGVHIDPFTKREVKHVKGEWKLNDDGEYYTETLGGRSPIGKEVVSLGDYVTSENSRLNDYDFFDSDGLDKSVTGTIAKNLAAAAPLMFLGPTGAMVYGGLFVGRELSKTLPMLYGMFLSFTGLEVLDNKLLNTISAYGQKFTTGTSEYAKNNIFSAENGINLLGEVALQWGLLKAIVNAYSRLTSGVDKSLSTAYNKAAREYMELATKAYTNGTSTARLIELAGGSSLVEFKSLINSGKWADTIFGKIARDKYIPAAKAAMQSRMKAGQDLSLVYMALISNTDVYESVLLKGGTPLEASAIALGSAIGMFGVDKYLHLGEIFFDDPTVRKSFRNAWLKEGSDILDVIRKDISPTPINDKKGLTNIILKSINKSKEFVTNYHSRLKDHSLGFLGKAAGEGLEEVSEELVADISKWMGGLAGKLGYASLTDYGAFENPFERYVMSFLGGAAGGGMFYGIEAYQKRNDPKIQEGENELIYLIRNHKKEDLMKELDSLHRKGKLGSTTLSYETATGANNENYFITADSTHESQNDYVYKRLKNIYNQLDIIINNNKVGLSEDELFLNLILSESRYNRLKDYLEDKSYSTRYLEEFHKIAKDLTDVDLAIENLNNSTKDSDPLYLEKLQELLKQKQELLKKRDEFLSGESSLHYIKKMLFAIDPALRGLFMSVNLDQFSRLNTGRAFRDLSEAELEAVNKAYDEYKSKEKVNLDEAFSIYEQLEKQIAPELENISLFDAKLELERFLEMLEKYPTKQYLTWDSKLDSETEEEYKNRNQLEGEDDETFNARKLKREEAIKKYNNDHITEFIKNFAEVGLDSSNFRLMHLVLANRRKDIIEAIKLSFKFGEVDETNPNKLKSVDVETTNLIRNLLVPGKSLQSILEDLRTAVTELLKNKINKKYEKVRGQDLGWQGLKEYVSTGENLLMTGNLIIQAISKLKELYITQQGYTEELFEKELPDIIHGLFDSQQVIDRILRIYNLHKSIESTTSIRNSVLNDVSHELQSTGQIDPANISEEDIQKINQITDNRIAELILNLSKELSSLYDLGEDLLTFDEIIHLANTFVNLEEEINLKMIDQEISESTELIVNATAPNIAKIIDELKNNSYLKAFDALEQNLYKNNPALLFFSKITAKVGNVNVNIEEFLESLHKRYLEIDNFLDFKLTDEDKKILETLKLNLQTFSAFIYAASKDTSSDSPVGQNKSVNEFIDHHSDIFSKDQKLPEMSEELGLFLMLELYTYQQEINSWLDRAESNRVDRISMFTEAETALNKSLKKFYDENKSKMKVKGVDLLEGYTNETTVLNAERLLYDNVLKGINEGKFTLEDVFEIIPDIVTDPLNIQNLVPTKLDNKIEYLNDYDKFTYFIATISMPTDSYRQTLKDFIQNNSNIVPISLLMYAGKILLAMLINPTYVNAALKWATSTFAIKLPVLPNTAICTGVGGAGKTEVLGRIATKDQGANTWVSGPTQSQINEIVKPNKLAKAKGIDIWDLVGLIIGKSNADKLKSDIDSVSENSDFYDKVKAIDGANTTVLKESVQILSIQNSPEVIIIDEATHIPNIVLLIIAKFAENNNSHLLLLGDNTQSGLDNGFIHNVSKEHVFGWRTPKLYLSLRGTNILKYYNQLGLLLMIDPLLDSIGEVAEKAARSEIDKLLSKYKFRYHIGDELSGEFVTKELDNLIIQILLNNTKDGSKVVGFIGNANSPKYKLLQDAGVNLTPAMDIKDILGREFDYVVVDRNWDIDIQNSDTPDFAEWARNLYTVITRSMKGTILIDNNLSKNILSLKDLLTGPASDIRSAIEEFREKVLSDLEDIRLPDVPKSVDNPAPEPSPEPSPASIDLSAETSLTIPPSKDLKKEADVNNKEVEKKLQKRDYPIRCYTNLHVRNAHVKGKKWIGNGSNKDISIFLKENEEANQKELDKLVELLLQLKSLLIFGDKYYPLADNKIKSLFKKDAFLNVEYFLTSEDVNQTDSDDNALIGLTSLKNKNRAIQGKLITLIAKLKGNDGNIYTVTLGGVANPETWKKYADLIISNPNASEEDKEYAKTLLTSIIPDYENVISELISNGKDVPVDVSMSLMTDLISKDGDGNPNPEIRLRDINIIDESLSHRNPYDNKTKYARRSSVYVFKEEIPGIDKHWIGRPVMFVSSNVFLNPNDLMLLYINAKKNGTYSGIRMIPLSNKGVSFKSLYRLKWSPIYTTQANKATMPFELLPLGIRMYISMWNFRANLLKFMNILGEWKGGNNSENRVLSDDEVMDLIKLDLDEYNKITDNGKKYVDELTYRKSVSDPSKLKLLWDFNDSLAGSVREFRLGYNTNNGFIIRTLTNLGKNNPFYSEQIAKGKSIQGIYIRPDVAKKYLDTLNTLFNNVINKIIPTDRDSLEWIDKKQSLDDDWFKQKLLDRTSIKVSGIDKDGKPSEFTIDFLNESNLKMIPMTMVLISKYLEIRQYNPERFDETYNSEEEFDDPRYHIFITNPDGSKTSLNYISIADVLGLKLTITEGNTVQGLGLKPYDSENEIGVVDRNYDNLISLMFHGLVETKVDNNFDNPSDLRAEDADFKYGFFSDPVAYKTDSEVADIATNEALFSTNLIPGFPIVTFKIKLDLPLNQTLQLPPVKPIEKPSLIVSLKEQLVLKMSSIGITIPSRALNKINTELELIDYVNSLLNPIFAKGLNLNKIDAIRRKSVIYKYFTNLQPDKVSELIDHVEIQNGQLVYIPIDLGLNIDESWNEEWNDGIKILESPDGKKYKVLFNEDTNKIIVEAMDKVNIEGTENPVSGVVEPTFGNIEFTIIKSIDESLNSIDNSFADDLRLMVSDEFLNADKDLIPSDETISEIINNISKKLKEDYNFDDIEGWNVAVDKLINEVLSEITSEKRLREGCIM